MLKFLEYILAVKYILKLYVLKAPYMIYIITEVIFRGPNGQFTQFNSR